MNSHGEKDIGPPGEVKSELFTLLVGLEPFDSADMVSEGPSRRSMETTH